MAGDVSPVAMFQFYITDICQISESFAKSSASKKVLNSGLGPFKDQTAEMVLFWSFFYTKVLFFGNNN